MLKSPPNALSFRKVIPLCYSLSFLGWASTSLFTSTADAEIKRWNSTEGEWTANDDWLPAPRPKAADWAIVDNGGVLFVPPDESGGTHQVLNLTVGHTTPEQPNQMKVEKGASIAVSGNVVLASDRNVLGAVQIEGTLEIAKQLQIANLGQGSLEILDGSTVKGGQMSIGRHQGSKGELTIHTGGRLETVSASIGGDAGGEAQVSLSGEWVNAATLIIGLASEGRVEIKKRGTLSNQGILSLGEISGSKGTLTVRGTVDNLGGILRIGRQGQGVLNLGEDGIINLEPGNLANRIVYLAHLAHMEGGGEEVTGTLTIGGAIDGKIAGPAEAPGILNADTVQGNDKAGRSEVNFNHTSSDYHFTTTGTSDGDPISIKGRRTMVRQFAGKTTLSGEQLYEAPPEIIGGELAIMAPHQLGNRRIVVAGGTLRMLPDPAAEAIPSPITFSGDDARCIMMPRPDGIYPQGTFISEMSGGRALTVHLKSGKMEAGRELTLRMSGKSAGLPPNDARRESDIITFTGIEVGTPYVIELMTCEVTKESAIGWNREGRSWEIAGGDSYPYIGSYEKFRREQSGELRAHRGVRGIDLQKGSVWVIADQPGEYAMISTAPAQTLPWTPLALFSGATQLR